MQYSHDSPSALDDEKSNNESHKDKNKRTTGKLSETDNVTDIMMDTNENEYAVRESDDEQQAASRYTDIIAAALVYNSLTPREGYCIFDVDEDGHVSEQDMQNATSALGLELTAPQVSHLYKHLDAQNKGYISQEQWIAAMSEADPLAALMSRGLVLDSDGVPRKPLSKALGGPGGLDAAVELLAARIHADNLTAELAYDIMFGHGRHRETASVRNSIMTRMQVELTLEEVDAVVGAMCTHNEAMHMHETDTVRLDGFTMVLAKAQGAESIRKQGYAALPVISAKSGVSTMPSTILEDDDDLCANTDECQGEDPGRHVQADAPRASFCDSELRITPPHDDENILVLESESEIIHTEDAESDSELVTMKEDMREILSESESNTKQRGEDSESEKIALKEDAQAVLHRVSSSLVALFCASDMTPGEGYQAFDADRYVCIYVCDYVSVYGYV
jgi:hypothetical protein